MAKGSPSPLEQFIAARDEGDDACLALGRETLEAALAEADEKFLNGWSEAIYEFVVAARDGKPLNRPL